MVDGNKLLIRWNIDIWELHQIIFQMSLHVYNTEYKREKKVTFTESSMGYDEDEMCEIVEITEKNNLKEFDDYIKNQQQDRINIYGKAETLDKLYFKIEDIIKFEQEHGISGNDIPDKNSLSANERREFGRLNNEKSKWNESIKASVEIGTYCKELSEQKNNLM